MSNLNLEYLTKKSDLDKITLEYIAGFRRKPWEEEGEFMSTFDYILSEMAMPNFMGFLKFVGNELAAFGWSYQENVESLVKHKYNTQTARDNVIQVVRQVVPDGMLNYISEVVTIEKFGQQGYGREIVSSLSANQQIPSILRTHRNSIGMNKICRSLGFFTLPFTDTELPRVLYIRPNN